LLKHYGGALTSITGTGIDFGENQETQNEEYAKSDEDSKVLEF
jgi:hypothetical protein